MRILKNTKVLGVPVAVIVLAMVAVPAPAHSAEQVTCVITESITWSPPLKNQAQRVTFTASGQLTGCNGLSATATYFETGTLQRGSCNSFLGSGPGIRVWDWTAPGVASSVFSYLVIVERVAGTYVAVATGPIIAGAYTDSAARSVGVAPAPDVLACAGDGVARMVAAGTVTIGI